MTGSSSPSQLPARYAQPVRELTRPGSKARPGPELCAKARNQTRQTACSKSPLFLKPGKDLFIRKTYPPATRHRRRKSEPSAQHGQPDCGDPRSAGRRSSATGGEGAGGTAEKEQGRGQEEEEKEAKSQSGRAARASGESGLSPEQLASGALILSRGLAERSVAHGSSEAEI